MRTAEQYRKDAAAIRKAFHDETSDRNFYGAPLERRVAFLEWSLSNLAGEVARAFEELAGAMETGRSPLAEPLAQQKGAASTDGPK